METVQHKSNLVKSLYDLALVGSEWVLWLLIGLSVVLFAVIIERIVFYARRGGDADALARDMVERLNGGDTKGAAAALEASKLPAAAVAAEGVRNLDRGVRVIEEVTEAAAIAVKRELDRFLPVMGTIGSNAPYVGLLGTVLGIVQSFNILSKGDAEGPNAVMGGIAEALVSTAVGLAVAIPAVVAYNYFRTRATRALDDGRRLVNLVLAVAEDRAVKAKE